MAGFETRKYDFREGILTICASYIFFFTISTRFHAISINSTKETGSSLSYRCKYMYYVKRKSLLTRPQLCFWPTCLHKLYRTNSLELIPIPFQLFSPVRSIKLENMASLLDRMNIAPKPNQGVGPIRSKTSNRASPYVCTNSVSFKCTSHWMWAYSPPIESWSGPRKPYT